MHATLTLHNPHNDIPGVLKGIVSAYSDALTFGAATLTDGHYSLPILAPWLETAWGTAAQVGTATFTYHPARKGRERYWTCRIEIDPTA